jgi:hypothetical protein
MSSSFAETIAFGKGVAAQGDMKQLVFPQSRANDTQ